MSDQTPATSDGSSRFTISSDFPNLHNQKESDELHYDERTKEAAGLQPQRDQHTCETEDHSFQGTKPGQESDTLPGWETLKDGVKGMAGSR
ncbi:hypothetical protein P168DRAFT_322278 [Aspergillus campestris IBT 28561]|uniref:Uncharacterized protein n=1 Tax=Aspergillus campestris (strain IBT 28561) TaxID=1392248 RepID=A0A2I1CRG3_ASPC2|nr:uncharacterized protein P168DRAFT_322278 [Aspergillus campestris IBT 28561]PKY00214.1 hypothetical protein P168DRAFT_322278 [Aspergillus campestris IBT 28561]